MDPTPTPVSDRGEPRSWTALAAARRAQFEAQDAMTAVFLQRAGGGTSLSGARSGSIGAPPFAFSLEKPAKPRSWRKRLAARKLERKRRQELLDSGLFDDAWYRSHYPDVARSGQDPLVHFLEHGSYEGRSPGPGFNAMGYLARYPDVVEERIEPWLHFARHGRSEGRSSV
jgi:hypothetical protein